MALPKEKTEAIALTHNRKNAVTNCFSLGRTELCRGSNKKEPPSTRPRRERQSQDQVAKSRISTPNPEGMLGLAWDPGLMPQNIYSQRKLPPPMGQEYAGFCPEVMPGTTCMAGSECQETAEATCCISVVFFFFTLLPCQMPMKGALPQPINNQD